MQLLNGPEAEREIKKLLDAAEWVRIAVPYWGKNAVTRLGLDRLRTDDVRIVCNLLSGGCNPDEIEKLNKIFGNNIKTNNNIHAKVYLTDKGVVLGSSNASTNGLGSEGSKSEVLNEMNIKIENVDKIKNLEKWYNSIESKSRNITKSDLDEAKLLYRKIKNILPLKDGSIIDLAANDPSEFDGRDIEVWVWDRPEASASAYRHFEIEKKNWKNDDLTFYEECGDLKPGSIIIDIDMKSNPISVSFFQIIKDYPKREFIKNGNKTYLHLCLEIEKLDGHDFGDVSRWIDAARVARKKSKREDWSLSEFASKFLR